MSINFHDANNKYTYATRNAHVSWEEMIKNITDIQNKQIIDIGCGGGIYTKELALMGAKNVVGLDFSKEILQAAKENCSGFPNISFIHGDAHSIPYPDETFDIVISRAVIHHLQDIPTFLREASRILKKNGVLILQDRTIEDCAIPGSPEHIRGYFFSVFPKLIEIESKRRPKTATIQQELQKHSLHVFPSQTQWEVRKIHDSVAALLQDLSPRTGRSILYELTDHELAQLLHHIQIALQNISPIIERDRWTIWSGRKL
ncbi:MULTISPECIES: class I SAM-dependent methyltransferase [Bacillus cereus group]|uniref:class I SAM-dependent methyltransferase n=1 Tax=Bacillus cereus group TaxID=86661 RepID=UPI000872E562|nr:MULTISPECIES: class I SAM-dependent methyltransferase [Bacillus cereus group]OFD05049.1 SAM-dependent methyltransferase [Bacillus thuringiensis]MBJ8044816.1 class I SAM-dependent methyltransferase [Bacillus cereus group sp. N18]OFD09997.1 SAM-dependent methyltransferase [Bacillus thuringiensis]PDZ84946.1 class I SAM-dependent methyltransferase [Bacillus toyonensis]PEI67769.1 class I SAM-dependent methyltransferase [Bacillus toyonensis]